LFLQDESDPKCHPCKRFARGSLLDALPFETVRARIGVKLRPTIEREKLYRLVLELRKEGLTYNQIIRKIESEHEAKLRKSHISDWISGKHRPFGYVRAFDPTPRRELAYVIGVKMGDASMSVNKNHNYMVKLKVIDKDFAVEFSRCLSVILGRNPPRVNWHEKTHAWRTELSSLLLQNFLGQDLRALTSTIEHCADCKGAFLRGFFDSEGSISGRSLLVYNGDLDKLEFVCLLLSSLGISTTGPHLRGKSGGMVSIKGKLYHVNKNQYYVYVRAKSLRAFRDSVGFMISRKKDHLQDALLNLVKRRISPN
jgi:intein-encoded DNA endonuclease-like protein